MLYIFVKILVRAGLLLYCRKITFTNKNFLNEKGPLLLACNHPNSFFDAILLGAFFKRPVHFLARGDAFKQPFAKKMLTALKLIPIYRLREGKEYLALNDATFERCAGILRSGGIVLIFSEGLCENTWRLRQLKKGSARIAVNAWKQPGLEDVFRILPVSLNYSTFTHFRKRVTIDFGKPITKSDITKENEGEQIVELNRLIYTRLELGLLLEKEGSAPVQFLLTNSSIIKDHLSNAIDYLKQKQKSLSKNCEQTFHRLKGTKKLSFDSLSFLINLLSSIVLFIPAIVGLIVHLPIFWPLNSFIKKKTTGTVFYHSALFGALIIIYPLYLLVITAVLLSIFDTPIFLSLIVLLPLFALIFLKWQDSMESSLNYLKLSKQERSQLHKLLQ